MDQRIALEKNSILHFPGMECVIGSCVGKGSNVIAYTGSYRDSQNPSLSHLVLIRELYPYDPEGGISRSVKGSLQIEPFSQQLYDFNKMTFERGNEVHIRLAGTFPSDIDVNINTFEYNNTLYSLLGFSGGRTLDRDLKHFEPAPEKNSMVSGNKTGELLRIIRIVKGALSVLQSFHEAGYLHLDISPDNILLIGGGDKERVTLIDYNSVHTLQEIRRHRAVYFSTKEGYTAPEVHMGRISGIREWTDLYSVAAVFYRCLAGRKLTPLQMIGNAPINVTEENPGLLEGCPESALSMLRRILRKGLAVTPRRRYHRASQMMADLTELEDRIIGRGITHWALWENGRKQIRKALQENTALNYILDEKKIYPLYAETDDGKRISLLQDLWTSDDPQETAGLPAAAGLQGASHAPVLLLGGGGMGKTTALFRLSCVQQNSYTAGSTAVYYISLYGYRDRNPHYICDYLLQSLKFKQHTDSMESARRELKQLLDRPMPASPAFLLLLDGLNEASGDTGPLLEEIHTLSGFAGVQIVLTGRSDPGDSIFRRLVLCRLEQAEVRKILAEEGILPPENMEVFDLLSFPMLLSMYIRTVRNGERQLRLGSREELLKDYFDAILEKERRDLPADQNSFMGVDAAVRYLLPEIAALAAEKQQALAPQDLLRVTEECYREFSRRVLTVIYPEWIGSTAQLRLGTNSADEWYGQAVLELLWRRLGLLVRDEEGHFRVPHQILEEYLSEQSAVFHEKFDREKRRQRRWGILIGLSAACVLAFLFAAYNAHILARLSQQHKQLLEQNSASQVRISENARQNGNRYEALQAALRALTSDTEDLPVTTEAIHALASSLRTFHSPTFQVTCAVELPDEALRIAVSPNGDFLTVLDKSSALHCYDGRTGEKLWKRIGRPNDHSIQILEEESSVLLIGNEHIAAFSLEEGQCIWEKNVLCENYLIQDRELIFAGMEDRTIRFSRIDLRTGDQTAPPVETVLDCGIGDYCPLHNGKFVCYPDAGIRFLLLRKVHGVYEYTDLVLDRIDISDGTCLKPVSIPVDKKTTDMDIDWDDHVPYSVIYVPAEMSTTACGGLFFCFDLPDYGNDGTRLITGFLEDENSTWSHFEQYEMSLSCISDEVIYPAAAVPVLHLLPDHRIMILYGSELITLNLPDEDEVHQTIPFITREEYTLTTSFKSSNILFCRIEDDPFSLFVLYEDGSAEYMDQYAHVKKEQLLDKSLRMACGAGKKSPYSMDDGTLLSESGCQQAYQDAFCLLQADSRRNAYVVSLTGDTDGRSLTEKGMCDNLAAREEQTGDLLHVMPDGKSLLALYPLTLVNSDEFTRQMEAVVIDLSDMKVKKRSSFVIPKEDISLQDISADGKTLFFRRHTYDLETETLQKTGPSAVWNDPSRIIPENGQFIRESCQQTYYAAEDGWKLDNGTDWDGETIHWVFHGKEHKVSLLDNGSNVLEHRVLEYSADFKGDDRQYYSYDEIVSGDNGLLFVRCTEEEKSRYGLRNVDYLMVYSLKTGKWEKVMLPDGTEADVMPYPADSEQLFAIGGADNAVRIYDMDSKEFIMTCKADINHENIQKMSFIMDDSFLAVWDILGFSIFDVSTGEQVFYRAAGRDHRLDDTYSGFVFEDDDGLFVAGKAGFCLDPVHWEIRYDIPFLETVTQDRIITREDDTITQYPAYSVEDLIREGKEALEMLRK